MTYVGTAARRFLILAVGLALAVGALALLPTTRAEAAFPGENGWIVFGSGTDVYAMPSDGSEAPTNLSAGIGAALADPVFSPHGTQIALSRSDTGVANIFIANFNASGPSLSAVAGWAQVSNGGEDGEPTWSPDGTEIAYQRKVTTQVAAGIVEGLDVTGVTLTDAEADWSLVSVGDKVTNTSAGNWTGTVGSIDSATQITVANPTGGWAVGNNYKIEAIHRGIYKSTANGSNKPGTQISEDAFVFNYDDTAPSWSPDGSAIAYASTQNGNSDVYVTDTSGTTHTNLTNDVGSLATRPNWSPDGAKLAYQYQSATGWNIYTMAAAGTGKSAVTTGTEVNEHPVWSPDGTKIAFRRGGGTLGQTFVVAATGGAASQVWSVVTAAVHDEPDWQPVVPVDPDAPVVAVAGDDVGAPGLASSFSASVTGGTGSPSYTWSVTKDGSVVDGAVPSGASLAFTPTEGGAYVVSVTATDALGSDNDSKDFKVLGDIGSSPFRDDIIWLATEGITRGCNPPANDLFCPAGVVTRGQMAAFLVRAMDLTDDGGGNKFVDDDGSVFEDDIAKLAAAGITRGCNPPVNDRFCPDDSVTRGQMAAFLVRAFDLTDDGGGNKFVDDDGSVFEDDIAKLAAAGITRGCNPPVNDKFCADNVVTRGQMAAFLHRAESWLP